METLCQDIYRRKKSMLIVDTPKSCEECKCSMMSMGKLYCPHRGTEVSKGERDCACPLMGVRDVK